MYAEELCCVLQMLRTSCEFWRAAKSVTTGFIRQHPLIVTVVPNQFPTDPPKLVV